MSEVEKLVEIDEVSDSEELTDIDTTDSGERETVEVYVDDLEDILKSLDELESEEDISTKIDRTLIEERNIYIEGTIDNSTSSQVTAMIHYYNAIDNEKDIPIEERSSIKLYLNSPGGSLSSGKNILAAMEGSKTPIETISQGGQLASMAFVLFVGANIRKMSRHSEPMYHNLLAGVDGSFSEMKNQISYFERLQNEMDEFVAERTKIPLKKMKKLRQKNQDWHLTFNECRDYEVFTEQI